MRSWPLAMMLIFCAGHAQSQSFSCPIGKDPACLDYGAKVCGTFGMCVDSNAVCFNKNQCGFDGFVCKSDLDEIRTKTKKFLTTYDGLKDCIASAKTLDDAKSCSLYY